MMLTLSDYYQGRDVKFSKELTIDLQKNAEKTVARASELLAAFGENRKVRSGWRPAEINAATPGAAKNSNHIYCMAIDLEDNDNRLGKWCEQNQERLAEMGLWMESQIKPDGTRRDWVHVQTVPPKSGHRIYMP